MTNFQDIFDFMSKILIENNWIQADLNTQKQIIDLGLKRYIIVKIYSIDPHYNIKSSNIAVLFNDLVRRVNKIKYPELVRCFNQYLLNIISNLQGWVMTWYFNEFLKDGQVLINTEDGKWNNIRTNYHIDTDTFLNFYNYFQKDFKVNNYTLKLA